MEQTPSLDTKVEFVHDSEKVNSVDLHPTKPWILVGLDSGNVVIWNYKTKTEEKSFKVSESPVRSAKFIARESRIVAAGDDKFIHDYDYNSGKSVGEFSAHTDIIRSVAVHPEPLCVISAGDDKVIKKWNWIGDRWQHAGTFQGHSNSVMQVAFDPIHTSTFASASLDRTLKIWNLNSLTTPPITLDGHSDGVNCVDYFTYKNNLYLLSGSSDCIAKVWNYATKVCVQTLEHESKVTAVSHHPMLPILITASEDGPVNIWDVVTYKHKITWNSELGTVWSIGYKKGSDDLAFGGDKGFKVVQMSPVNLQGQASNKE